MNAKERGFLLLTSDLGDCCREPLTVAQFRRLALAVTDSDKKDSPRDIVKEDLTQLGYSSDCARQIVRLLGEESKLNRYCENGETYHCFPLTRLSKGYPLLVRRRLGLDAPGCFWTKGDLSLLNLPAISLVGSRGLMEENSRFAAKVGIAAAENGIVLVSGNARGADQTAQDSCLAHGGKVISVIADELWRQPDREGILYLSESGYDSRFSAQRAHSRNRVIHSIGMATFVAQCADETGGTWAGTTKNLSKGWSPVAVFEDGSKAVQKLCRRGAVSISISDLTDFEKLLEELCFNKNFLDE